MNKTNSGWLHGCIGMLIFSGTLPATRVAVASFDPLFLTLARASIAGLCSVLILSLLRQKRPPSTDLGSLLCVALGVVIGFPLLTAYALQHIDSAHSLVFTGLLPIVTALFAVLRGGERPSPTFWLFSLAGSSLICTYAISRDSGAATRSDLLMLAAIAVGGLGYAEGARLSRRLGGWQVICWALTLALPLMATLAWLTRPLTLIDVSPAAWGGLAYVSLFSMLIGFIFWYRGLAEGGIAAVGQLQLLQPFFGLLLAAQLLHEPVGYTLLAVMFAAICCIAGARRFA